VISSRKGRRGSPATIVAKSGADPREISNREKGNGLRKKNSLEEKWKRSNSGEEERKVFELSNSRNTLQEGGLLALTRPRNRNRSPQPRTVERRNTRGRAQKGTIPIAPAARKKKFDRKEKGKEERLYSKKKGKGRAPT